MKKYMQYKAEQFAEDTEFIKWVQSDFTEHADKWDSFMNDNPSLGDEISEAIDIIELFQFDEKKVSSNQKDKLLTRINSSVDTAEKPAPVPAPTPVVEAVKPTTAPVKEVATANTSESKSILRFLIPLAAAACLGALVFFNMGGGEVSSPTLPATTSLSVNETSVGETTNLTLPDQSIVNLNATSTLTFDEKNFAKHRTVQLDGEAFFKVEKGQRFTIETKNGSVEVLGTSFNVISRGKTFEVECVTGKVKVVGKSGAASVVLTPNENCKLTGQQLIKNKAKVTDSE